MGRALHCAGMPNLIHYLDDFLFIGEPNTQQGKGSLEIALRTLKYLEVPVAAHKSEGDPGYQCNISGNCY